MLSPGPKSISYIQWEMLIWGAIINGQPDGYQVDADEL